MVEILLKAGARGPKVDAMLHAALDVPHKDMRLIELLVNSGACVKETDLFTAVSQGLSDIVKILLGARLTVETCSSAIALAMKLQDPKPRYEIIKTMLVPDNISSFKKESITQAVVDAIQKYPQDVSLLEILCYEGKADINLLDGRALCEAIHPGNPAALDIVLRAQGAAPNSSTIGLALRTAMGFPVHDPSRHRKVERLLQGVKPQQVMDDMLLRETQSAVTRKHDLSVLRSLLAAGANVNSNNGAVLVAAMKDSGITLNDSRNVPSESTMSLNDRRIIDIILQRKPNIHTLSIAFAHGMQLTGQAKYNICETLLKAGTRGDEVSKALCVAAKERDLQFLQLLLPHADVNFKEGRVLRRVVEQEFSEGLDLLLKSHPIVPSPASKSTAFYQAMKLSDRSSRFVIVNRLLNAKIPMQTISECLVVAVNNSDVDLVDSLLKSGASLDYGGGQAISRAATLGRVEILKLLVQGSCGRKPVLPILLSGFVGAAALMDKDPDSYFTTIEILLGAGARGGAIYDALIECVKRGEAFIRVTELLCRHNGTESVEWKDGAALEIAVRTAGMETLAVLLRQRPSQGVLDRVSKSAFKLTPDRRYPVIEALLNAGKPIDKDMSNVLSKLVRESPPDRALLELLLSRGCYDNGEAMIYAATHQDLPSLVSLVNPAVPKAYVNAAFEAMASLDEVWSTNEGFPIMETLLKNGATGEIVNLTLQSAVDKCCLDDSDLMRDFVDLLLKHGADAKRNEGAMLQQATMKANLGLVRSILSKSSTYTKALALPYVYSTTQDAEVVLQIIQAFAGSIPDVDRDTFTDFEHPNSQLDPVLFLALSKYPRKVGIIKVLLDLGYDPNQRKLHIMDGSKSSESCPILCWALVQAKNNISDAIIKVLVDRGANINFVLQSGMTPVLLAIKQGRADMVEKLISKGAILSASEAHDISPLALATRLGDSKIMEILLRADPERNDGSLHDAATNLKCNIIELLVGHGHQIDYPSERHDGRSALAELCFNAVNRSPKPDAKEIQRAVETLLAKGSDFMIRCISEDKQERSIFHYAMDSSDPVLILTVLLKKLWQGINNEAFLFKDAKYTYSLSMYVKKDIFKGPQDQKEEILRLLRTKRATDRFWATDIESEQPPDCCNPPEEIKQEAERQKLRRKRLTEQREDIINHNELNRLKMIKDIELQDLQATANLRRLQEKSKSEIHYMTQIAETRLQLATTAEQESLRRLGYRQDRELDHLRSLSDVQVSTRKQLAQESLTEEQERTQLQLDFTTKKVASENDGLKARFAIEGSAREDMDEYERRRHDREMARINVQKALVEGQTSLAAVVQAGGVAQKQIGFVDGWVWWFYV
ncbi:putative ankyrin repeat protein [Glarea lozoyensis 74030]|uniref:Putative ankyrin repeat protein n=1 Tax=Glarea lozoyensis (strain ATCC 74030 / MF5533) TaxID=1104152 RepID=H0EML5_GLAL7|nr:putative ankyrin repeat protein [Glarea lozoyensis 74030]